MISVGIKELKEKLSSYVDKVRHGEEVVVTDRGRRSPWSSPSPVIGAPSSAFVESGKAKWTGGKPAGLRGIKTKGKSLSRTVLEDRR